MPYIKQTDRLKLDKVLDEYMKVADNLTAGELNFLISSMIWYLFDNKKGYTKANELMGVLSGVSQEFYRRRVAPYEVEKINENGDLT